VTSASGKAYSVFTPYSKAWFAKLDDAHLNPYPVEHFLGSLEKCDPVPVPSLESLGFEKQFLSIPPGMSGAETLLSDFEERIDRYRELRDYPAINGTSRLSAHLRFGTISVRRLANIAHRRRNPGAETFLSELAWRDFFQMIIYHHPHLSRGHAFRPEYEHLPFENDPEKYDAWRKGKTGYPLIDAAMRQLDVEGCMHNRLRMIAASFLVKDLHVDWRWGEKHFAEKLLDFDFASNNGGWQWAASTGCDAQPWFRIFNPVTQSEKFDPNGEYIRKHVGELEKCPVKWIHSPWKMPESERSHYDYPEPIVIHSEARKKALEIYGR
jgi:deoxyribodipyrimidine photo-lyase